MNNSACIKNSANTIIDDAKLIIVTITWFLFFSLLPIGVFGQDGNSVDLEEESILEEVLVVSSATRLTSGFESPKPTTTLDKSAFEARGISNVADIVNEIPSFVGSETPSSTTLSGAGSGSNLLSLRFLGPNRSLILVDKQRWVPTSNFGFVDVNTIPQTLIQQVEVVTGGASAQWGSDAVAGVVNFRMNRNLEGGKFEARYGVSGENDAKDTLVSFGYGFSFADDRGHVSFGIEYADNKGIGGQGERDWGRELWGIVGNPDNTGSDDGIPDRIIVPNVLFGLGTPGGYLPIAFGNHPAVAQTYFGPGGEVLPYDIGDYPFPSALAALPFQVGGSGGSLGIASNLVAPIERTAAMGLFDYELTDTVGLFLDLSWSETKSANEIAQPFNLLGSGPDVIFGDNPFIPQSLKQVMDDNGVPVLIMARTNEDHGFITEDRNTETKRMAIGFQGDLRGWLWDAYYTHGESDTTTRGINNILVANRVAAVNAVTDPITGEIVCRANVGGANGMPGCEPLNLFGAGAPSQAALDYIHQTALGAEGNKQDVIAASISGEALDLPAGPLALAFGLEYRKEKGYTDKDPTAEAGGYFLSNGQSHSGNFDVKEAFIEAGIPILNNGSGMTFDINAAVRYANYSTSGSTVPWQLGATFSPIIDLTFRGTVSRDIRAPNITELFSAERLAFNNVINPETGEENFIKVSQGGNPDLAEEDAKTVTLGVVYQPGRLEGFKVSLDWYKTEIDDAIGALPVQTIVDNCYNLGIACENIETEGNQIVSVDARLFNISNRTVEGIDFDVVYLLNNVGNGSIQFRWLASHYIENSFSPDSVSVFDDVGVVGPDALGGIPTPEWRWNLSADYVRDRLGLLAQVIYTGGGDYMNDWGPEDINDNSVSSQTLVNLGIRYDFPFSDDRNLQLFAGINNAFDQDPPVAPLGFVVNLGTNVFLYNVMGRNYYAGARFSF